MDIQFHGANCITLGVKQSRLVFDDNLAELGGKSITRDGDIALFSGERSQSPKVAKLTIDQPGEYEVAGISVFGIATRSHIDDPGKQSATMYKIVADDLSLLVVGHISPELSDDQLESIGMVDVMLVPVGGNGFTLDGVGALKIIKKIEPKMVIPTHYDDSNLQFPVPAQTLEQALNSLGMEVKDTLPKLRLKSADLTDSMQLIVLEKV